MTTGQLGPEHRRASTTAALFGNAFPFQIEPAAYYWADRLSPDYHGGYWLFYTVGPAFYMAPDSDSGFDVLSPNGYEGHLSSEAFGIVVCLFAYSSLAFKSRPGFSSESAHTEITPHVTFRSRTKAGAPAECYGSKRSSFRASMARKCLVLPVSNTRLCSSAVAAIKASASFKPSASAWASMSVIASSDIAVVRGRICAC